jgi:hypothetical protein
VKLNEFDHEAVIGAGDSPLLFDELFCLLIVETELEDYKSYDESNRSRNPLDAMNEHISLVFLAIQYQVDYIVE